MFPKSRLRILIKGPDNAQTESTFVISKITTLLRGFQNFSLDENGTQSGPRDLSMERLRDIIPIDSIDL